MLPPPSSFQSIPHPDPHSLNSSDTKSLSGSGDAAENSGRRFRAETWTLSDNVKRKLNSATRERQAGILLTGKR